MAALITIATIIGTFIPVCNIVMEDVLSPFG
jgi:hypothetical protein